MKRMFVLSVLLIILFVSGCANNIPLLTLSNVEWYTTTETIGKLTFGYVHLSLSGATDGERVTVMTYGDGLISEEELILTDDKKFNQDIIIKFTHSADSEPRVYSTVVTAYNGTIQKKIDLVSQKLSFIIEE